eukprot:TRINITY_DN5917_c0_g1_i1.p1 TRINITY_DN5917_c0_g1~~TRINITY_DN5917_c0_g1_i1.p1  ORF type:complete len:559 (+),score=141.50 TRINITY_DN5917_c0_g1_i1:417-2093(+)
MEAPTPHSSFPFANRQDEINGVNRSGVSSPYSRSSEPGTLDSFKNNFGPMMYDSKESRNGEKDAPEMNSNANPNSNQIGDNRNRLSPLPPISSGGPNYPHRIIGENTSFIPKRIRPEYPPVVENAEGSDPEYYRSVWEKTFLNMREEIESLKLELALAQNLRYTAEERSIQLSYELQTMRISEAANYRAFVDLQKQVANGTFPPPNQWSVQSYKNQLDDLSTENKEVRKELSLVLVELASAKNEISRLSVKPKQPGANRKAKQQQTPNHRNSDLNRLQDDPSNFVQSGNFTVIRSSNSKISERTVESEGNQRVGRTRLHQGYLQKDVIRDQLELLYSEELLIRSDDFDDQYFVIWITEPVGVNVSILVNEGKTDLEVLFTWGDGVRSESVRPPYPILTGACRRYFPIPNDFKTNEHPQKSFTFYMDVGNNNDHKHGVTLQSAVERNNAIYNEDSLPTDHEDDETDVVDGFTIDSSEIKEEETSPSHNRKMGVMDPIPSPTVTGFDSKKRFSEEAGATCFACHKHHISCDRKRPCANCTKKGIPCVEKQVKRNVKKPRE